MDFKLEPMNINGNTVDLISARKVWEYLEVKTAFTKWIKRKIKSGGFINNEDFIWFGKIDKQLVKIDQHNKHLLNTGAYQEFHITPSMARRLGMMEHTDKGNELRIKLDNIIKTAINNPLPQEMSPAEQLLANAQLHMQHEQAQKALENKIDVAKEEIDHRIDILEGTVKLAQSQEVRPQAGFYGIKYLKNTLASIFQKSHIEGITVDPTTSPKIRKCQCVKHVDETGVGLSAYTAYNQDDMLAVINFLTDPNNHTRVLKSNGEPSEKVKSPYYGQPFKYPI